MRQVAAFAVCLWLAVVGCVAGLLVLSGGEMTLGDLTDFGLVFLAYAIVTSVVARRCVDASMVVVAIWGAAVGFWGPRWMALCDSAFDRWGAAGSLPELLMRDDLRAALAVAAAGILTAALLYIPTRSSKVVAQTVAAGLAVAVLAWLPIAGPWAMEAGVVVWHALVGAALCSWMVEGTRRREAGCCPRCGAEVRGLTSPVCPSCSAALATSLRPAPGIPAVMKRAI